MSKNETPLPKLPKGWRYERHECCSDKSGGPWIEVHAPWGADYFSVDTHDDANVLKWASVTFYIDSLDSSGATDQDLVRLAGRLKALRKVAGKLRAWARTENRRDHEVE